MQRRDFIRGSAALATMGALAGNLQADETSKGSEREFYELRKYVLRRGPKQRIVTQYLEQAAVPAWNRAGIQNVGVFNVMVGPENESIYVLLPCDSFATLLAVKEKIWADTEYQKAGAEYLNANLNDPAFVRMESSFFQAFAGMGKLEAPAKKARMFELRTYESPTEASGRKKVQMFNSGEVDIFRRAGLAPVFFGEAIIGAQLPQLTYMLTFANLDERAKGWEKFGGDSNWKRLSSEPQYQDIVSNITNIILTPANCSQI